MKLEEALTPFTSPEICNFLCKKGEFDVKKDLAASYIFNIGVILT